MIDRGRYSTREARFFRNLKDPLSNELKGALSRKIVDEVEILPSNEFVGKLSEQAITS